MKTVLEKQSKTLERLETIAKQDRLLQLVQAKELYDVDKDNDRLEVQLKELNETSKKGLLDDNGKALNSNVIKLFKSIEKLSVAIKPRGLNEREIKDITGKSEDRRQFNTLKPRVENIKEGVKDFFTMRGFLDKTGIVKRGSGGLVSEYLDRAEEKKKYVNNRMQMDPTARLHGVEKAREIFAKQFDKQQEIQYDISRNEKKIKEYKDQGFTEEQIARSPEGKKQGLLATELAKVDPRVRPEGFDPKTGKVKEKETPATAIGGGGKVIPFPSTADSASLSGEENMLEQNRIVADQTKLLQKIEENTRPKDITTNTPAPTTAKEEDSGFGLPSIGKGLKSIRGGLGKAGGLLKKAAPGLLKGGLLGIGGMAAEAGGDALKEAGYEETGKAVSTLGTAASYAGTGAMIGSFVPGIGTAIGAGVGGLIGLGKGLYDNYFSSDSSSNIAGEPFKKGTPLSEKQMVAVGKAKQSGDKIPQDVESQYQKQLSSLRASTATKQTQGDSLSKSSAETETIRMASSKAGAPSSPNVVSAPTVNNINNQTSIIRSPIRNEDNSLSRYIQSRYVAA